MAGPSFVPISFNATASSYIAYVRLPPTLMDKLEAEGASDMSISLSEGVLSVGGVSYKLDAVPEEGSFDVVREHGSKMCSVGAVRDKIIIKQTLDSAGRAQMKQRTAQGERDAHGHQTVSVEAPPPAAKRKTPTASKQVAKPSQQQRAKSARPLSTSPQGGAMSGTMTAPTGRTGSTGGLEDLRRWCLHILALGPLSLQSLEQQLQSAKQQQHVSHLAEARLLPKVLAQIADQRQDSQRHHLHTQHLSEACPSWRGYTAEQRSTLRATLASKGIEPATGKSEGRGAQSGRADGEGSAAGEVVIRNEAAYREQKKAFDRKYREYKQLDTELAEISTSFEALEEKYSGAPTDQQNRVAVELISTYEARKHELEAKTRTYRQLHLELQSIKAAVNKFVDERNAH